MKENLKVMNEKIKRDSLELIAKIDLVSEYKKTLKQIELHITEDVNNEVDSNGKKIFSNDVLRKIEIEKRLNSSEKSKEMQNKIDTLSREIKDDEINLEFLKNEMRNERLILMIENNISFS